MFQVTPFRPPGGLTDRWVEALHAWLNGRRASEVVMIAGDDGVGFLQDAFIYRLPWAMEAVRVHAKAIGQENADLLDGLAAMAVETGCVNRSVIKLLRAGLSSREAAIKAVTSTGASFDSRAGMLAWLRSEEIREKSQQADWPTIQTHSAWLQFLERERSANARKWLRVSQRLQVNWDNAPPTIGTSIVVEPNLQEDGGRILTPDLVKLGTYAGALGQSRRYIMGARVASTLEGVDVEFFGPVT